MLQACSKCFGNIITWREQIS